MPLSAYAVIRLSMVDVDVLMSHSTRPTFTPRRRQFSAHVGLFAQFTPTVKPPLSAPGATLATQISRTAVTVAARRDRAGGIGSDSFLVAAPLRIGHLAADTFPRSGETRP